MGSSLMKKVTPEQKSSDEKYSILDPDDRSDICRANFRFLERLTVTGHNQQQVIWLAENIRNPNQKFLVKQIDKLILYDNNRIELALKQLELWLSAYMQNNIASLFFGSLLFAFQDYQFLYMVYEHVEGFTLDSVLRNHVFNEEETKYVVAVVVQILEYFHQQNVALTELSPEHFVVEKKSGQIKLLQIFNPMAIDQVYTYTSLTNPSVYSSPEILAKNKVLAESDYYTLGTMMYEMMTQKNVVAKELSHLQVIQRHHIMAQEVELKKENLPERWNPQAADFLVKLLIKNPLFRLGRYGSFELRFHPWLQNYNWEILTTRFGISLTEPFFKKPQPKQFPTPTHIDTKESYQTILRNQLFLKLFENYTFRRKLTAKGMGIDSEQEIQSIKNAKKSQKYYDEKNSEEELSESEEEDEDQQENIEMESEEVGKESIESEQAKAKPARGLLNIIDKDG